MNEEQLRAREDLLTTGEIPKPYNFLIINNAMQEGWDLKDDLVKLAIMNTTNETEKIQAIGRLRRDLDILIYKTKKSADEIDEERVSLYVLPDNFKSTPLTSKMKKQLCIESGITTKNSKPVGWTTMKKILIAKDYTIQDTTKVIDGKQTRVSILSEPVD